MKHLIIYIFSLTLFMPLGYSNVELGPDVDPPSYTAPNGKTYTWGQNFAQLADDYSLAELVTMPVWICCGNTAFQKLPSAACRKGILNSGIQPHEVLKLSASKTYTNSLGNPFTPDPDRLRLYGFCIVEGDSRGVNQTVDINKVCDELKVQMEREGIQPCDDLTPQNIYPDYNKQLIYYTVCGKTYSKPMTDEFRTQTTEKEVVTEVVNCVDDFKNLPVIKICEGENYVWNIDGKKYEYDAPGTYLHSTPKADNCGKINTILNLDFYEPIDTTIVPTQKYDFAAGEVFTFQGMTLDSAGTYKKMYTDPNGCDAMATIVLQEKEAPQSNCTDCATNARDLGNIEAALRLNYGRQPISPDANPLALSPLHGALEVGLWKDWRNKRDLMNGITCKNNLFEYGIIGGLASHALHGSDPTECGCNDASAGSNIHAYLEPGVRWHLLGLCDSYRALPIPVVGAGLRAHYNDHKLDDISRWTLSPKVFAEGRWYFNQLWRAPRVASLLDTDREDINSLFFAIGAEAFAPAFQFDRSNWIGYLKLGYRF